MVCLCGAEHYDCVTRIGRETDVLLNWLRERGHTPVLLVADVNTQTHAQALLAHMTDNIADLYVYEDACLTPDENALGRLLLAANGDVKSMLAVGSGTLNDLVRYVSYRLHMPYYAVATAASMDGYTSTVAPLVVNGLKYTYKAHAPLGVLTCPDIFETAPSLMTAAGYGDMMGKICSLIDWEIETLVTGGDYCPVLADEMRTIMLKCLDGGTSKPEVVMRSLLDSGLVLQCMGNSKPASGSEHLLSHYWEMMALMRKQTPVLHGIKVGVASLVVLHAHKMMLSEPIDWLRAYESAKSFDINKWKNEMRRIYGCAAEGILAQWPDENAEHRVELIHKIKAAWPAIIRTVSSSDITVPYLKNALFRVGCPLEPYQIGISRDDFFNGVCHASRIRKRFSFWRLLDLLGLISDYAEKLTDMFSACD